MTNSSVGTYLVIIWISRILYIVVLGSGHFRDFKYVLIRYVQPSLNQTQLGYRVSQKFAASVSSLFRSLITNTNATLAVLHLSGVDNTSTVPKHHSSPTVFIPGHGWPRVLQPLSDTRGQSQKCRWPERSHAKWRHVLVPSNYWKESRASAETRSFGQFDMRCSAKFTSISVTDLVSDYICPERPGAKTAVDSGRQNVSSQGKWKTAGIALVFGSAEK